MKPANDPSELVDFEEFSEKPMNVNFKLQKQCLERLTSDSGMGS